MRIPAKFTESGFSLVEFMVAVLILTVGLFALLTTVQMAVRQNLSNKLRNDAVVLAERSLANCRSMTYANLVANADGQETRDIQRGSITTRYTIIRTVVPVPVTTSTGEIEQNTSNVTIEVRWLEQGDTGVFNVNGYHFHSVTTLVTDTLAN